MTHPAHGTPPRPGTARGIVCVFAKPPHPGRTKTRLAARVGERQASALARAFFDDTWSRVTSVPWLRPVLASTEEDLTAFGLDAAEVWLQGQGDLGQRMERVLSRALDTAPWVIALGADSPSMPLSALEAARAALLTHDAVLGPADDGGYYLLGLRRLPTNLLAQLPWSSPNTLQATHERLIARGLTVALIDRGFDVDEVEDLERLRRLLEVDPSLAPRTFAVLNSLPPLE